jgi:hypothetical protein
MFGVNRFAINDVKGGVIRLSLAFGVPIICEVFVELGTGLFPFYLSTIGRIISLVL